MLTAEINTPRARCSYSTLPSPEVDSYSGIWGPLLAQASIVVERVTVYNPATGVHAGEAIRRDGGIPSFYQFGYGQRRVIALVDKDPCTKAGGIDTARLHAGCISKPCAAIGCKTRRRIRRISNSRRTINRNGSSITSATMFWMRCHLPIRPSPGKTCRLLTRGSCLTAVEILPCACQFRPRRGRLGSRAATSRHPGLRQAVDRTATKIHDATHDQELVVRMSSTRLVGLVAADGAHGFWEMGTGWGGQP